MSANTKVWKQKNRQKVYASSKVYREKNRDKMIAYSKDYRTISCELLLDVYIKNQLGISDAPPELIEAKRAQLKLHRKIYNYGYKRKSKRISS